MEHWITQNEPALRFGVFFGLLIVLALAETLVPRRPLRGSRGFRWLHNLLLVVVDTAVLRFGFPFLAVAFAGLAQAEGWGLFNQIAAPYWLAVIVSFTVLDFIIYAQHGAFHAVPMLWRLHRVHHADIDIDASTGVRFHPIEIVLSMLIKFAAIAALGAPALAVILFEIVLNATSMFSHANLRLPAWLDRVLRLIVVTPDMHRVHHSIQRHETDSNFGFNFPWWDRLCGTYRKQPEQGHDGMTIGLPPYQAVTRQNIWWMLALPFRGSARG
jgi:sterol desaturase/sphingolipid hydroxylase (fatty acid hydroxylase superfamily)